MNKINSFVAIRWGLRLGGWLLLFLLLALPASQARAGSDAESDATSIDAYLNADGTLNLPAGQAISSLDLAGYQLVSKAGEAPRFAPMFATDNANWDARFPIPGTPVGSWTVWALAWDGTNLYAGGVFNSIGGVTASRIARWDGKTWNALGDGVDGNVQALLWDETNNHLYVGGTFNTAGGVTANRVARWDGTTWSALGSGGTTNGFVWDLAWDGTNLYVGGSFTEVDGTTGINRIARWDSMTNTWSGFGTGTPPGGTVYALAWRGTSLYAGGVFTSIDGVSANRIARWNSTTGTWSPLGTGVGNNVVHALVWGGPNLYAGGSFTSVNGVDEVNRIARWDGTTWHALGGGSGMNNTVRALAWDGATLYAGGLFSTADGNSVNRIASWDGTTWSALDTGVSAAVQALALDGAKLHVGGQFATASGLEVDRIARWNGTTWNAFGSGISNYVRSLAWDGTNLYAAGNFTEAGGVPANRVARWDGTTWSALGGGIENGQVDSLAWDGTNNHLYVGGAFTEVDGVAGVNRIARWDSIAETWSGFGTGINGTVHALAWDGTDLYVGGDFTEANGVAAYNIARWNTATNTWSPMGTGVDSSVFALAWDRTNNNLYAGGAFATASGLEVNHIARWDVGNESWNALDTGINGRVYALTWDGTSNDLYAGGNFTLASGAANTARIARWDSIAETWHPLGTGMTSGTVHALVWDGTNLHAGGTFASASGVANTTHIASWDGTDWSALGSGINDEVFALAWDGDSLYDSLYVGGQFTQAGDKPSSHIARWRYAAIWDGGGGDNDGSTPENWSGDTVPLPVDVAIFDNTSSKDAILDSAFIASLRGLVLEESYSGVVSQERDLALDEVQVQGGTLVVADPILLLPFTVEDSLVHSGGVISQTRSVDNANVPFLHIQNAGGTVTQYRGVEVDSTGSTANLGDVSVSIRAVDMADGEYCTNHHGTSPAYAERCYTITPRNDFQARVTLWALTSELRGIVEGDLAIYRNHPAGSMTWVEQTMNPDMGNDGGSYSYAQADVAGFSAFLLGDANAEPTAVTLQAIAASPGASLSLIVVSLLVIALLAASGLVLRRRMV